MEWVLFAQCCDKRFQVVAQRLRKHLGLSKGLYDPISVPGGAGNLLVMEHSFKLLCPIRPQQRLAVLTIHQDCAAAATKEDLVRCIELAKEYFPEVKGYVLKLDGSFEEICHWQRALASVVA